GLRRYRRTTARPHRQPSARTSTPGPAPTHRSRPDPAHHPRNQTPDRRHHAPTTRTHNPLGELATQPPSTLTLVPQTHQTHPQHRDHPGQLANGCCRTSPRLTSAPMWHWSYLDRPGFDGDLIVCL